MSNFSELEEKRKSESIAFAEPESNSEEKAASLQPPVNALPTSSAPIQKKDPDDPKGKKEDKGFDVDIKILPPKLQMSFWKFKLMADTGKTKLGFKHGDFGASLGYKYGSKLSLGASKGPFSGSVGYKPGGSDFTLGAGYKQGGFNAGLSVNPLGRSGSLSLGFGAPLAPMQGPFTSTMQSGGDAASNMMGQGPFAPFNAGPLSYYNMNKDNIKHISEAAKMAGDLSKQGKGLNFGAGVRLSASELSGFSIMFGVQGNFGFFQR